MEINQCPHCGVRVVATADGRCPSCRRRNEPEGATLPDGKPPIVNQPPWSPVREAPPDPESTSPYAGLARKIRQHGSAALAEHLSKDPLVVVIRSNESYERPCLARPLSAGTVWGRQPCIQLGRCRSVHATTTANLKIRSFMRLTVSTRNLCEDHLRQ